LDLLKAACPELDADGLAKLSIGERDARLLQLREWMFGTRLLNMADCPACSGRVEWETDVAEIRLESPQGHDSSAEFTVEVAGFSIRCRLPNSSDLLAVTRAATERSDPSELLARCIVDIRRNGKTCDLDDLSEDAIETLSRRMEELDPQADIRMSLTCPDCGHQWDAVFDIAGFLWTEINEWAERTLQSVHKLARAYGWSEQEILNMSPLRRRLYLEMVS
jgi:hypothetical protein